MSNYIREEVSALISASEMIKTAQSLMMNVIKLEHDNGLPKTHIGMVARWESDLEQINDELSAYLHNSHCVMFPE
jgi:hypothetical protein